MSSTQANFDEHSKLRNTVDCVGTCSSGHWSRRHRLHRLGLRRDGCGRVSRMAWGLRLGIVFWWMFTVGFGLVVLNVKTFKSVSKEIFTNISSRSFHFLNKIMLFLKQILATFSSIIMLILSLK
uniref:(northern house mosquito) hypothetical protein n=1 Tax=Culex pipiens TaxID=7175 RepID=A0A8D8HR43_CULPI